MKVVTLRRLGKASGVEHFVLKQGRMNMYLVSAPDSPYYQSPAFDRLLNFVTANLQRCKIKEVKGKRIISVSAVNNIQEAIDVLTALQ